MLQILTHVSILEYPPVITKPINGCISIGDLHGNFIKLLHLLIRLGIAELSEKHYTSLANIYMMPVEQITQRVLDDFKYLLNQMTFNYHSSIRLLGDELADRGSNDYFMLKLLQKLIANKLLSSILLSNHSICFLLQYEQRTHYDVPVMGRRELDTSMFNLSFLIRHKLLSRADINNLVEDYYLRSVKLLDYHLLKDEKKLTLFSHAPVGIEAIVNLASHFKIIPVKLSSYEELTNAVTQFLNTSTVEDVISIINRINEHIAAYLSSRELTINTSVFLDKGIDAILYVLWNRDYTRLILPEKIKDYSLYFIHGHDDSAPNSANRSTLDNSIGKVREQLNETANCPLHISSLTIPKPNFENAELLCDLIHVRHSKQIIDLLDKGLVSHNTLQRLLHAIPEILEGANVMWFICYHNVCEIIIYLANKNLITSEMLLLKPARSSYDKNGIELLFYYLHQESIICLAKVITPQMCVNLASQRNIEGSTGFKMLLQWQMGDLLLGLVPLLPQEQLKGLLKDKSETDVLSLLLDLKWEDHAKQNEIIQLLKERGALLTQPQEHIYTGGPTFFTVSQETAQNHPPMVYSI